MPVSEQEFDHLPTITWYYVRTSFLTSTFNMTSPLVLPHALHRVLPLVRLVKKLRQS
jgi:hypothetical protein